MYTQYKYALRKLYINKELPNLNKDSSVSLIIKKLDLI